MAWLNEPSFDTGHRRPVTSEKLSQSAAFLMDKSAKGQFCYFVSQFSPFVVNIPLHPGEECFEQMHVRIGLKRQRPRIGFLKSSLWMLQRSDQRLAEPHGDIHQIAALRQRLARRSQAEEGESLIIQRYAFVQRIAPRGYKRAYQAVSPNVMADKERERMFKGIAPRTLPSQSLRRRINVDLTCGDPSPAGRLESKSVLSNLLKEAAPLVIGPYCPPNRQRLI